MKPLSHRVCWNFGLCGSIELSGNTPKHCCVAHQCLIAANKNAGPVLTELHRAGFWSIVPGLLCDLFPIVKQLDAVKHGRGPDHQSTRLPTTWRPADSSPRP